MSTEKYRLPMVSVVMITYGHEDYIAEAIEGVLRQVVDFPVELIIADDCSADNTESIVQGFIQNHPNGHWINYTKHEKNKGMIPNFLWALEKAEGEFVALCDGDDYWTSSNKLQIQVNFLVKNLSLCSRSNSYSGEDSTINSLSMNSSSSIVGFADEASSRNLLISK